MVASASPVNFGVRTGLDREGPAYAVADIGQVAQVGAGDCVCDGVVEVALGAGFYTCEEVAHVEGGGVAGGPVGALFHDEFARIALIGLEALVAHGGPAVAAVEEISYRDVQRIACRSHHGGRGGTRVGSGGGRPRGDHA